MEHCVSDRRPVKVPGASFTDTHFSKFVFVRRGEQGRARGEITNICQTEELLLFSRGFFLHICHVECVTDSLSLLLKSGPL